MMDGQPEPSHGPVKARRITTEDAERAHEILDRTRGHVQATLAGIRESLIAEAFQTIGALADSVRRMGDDADRARLLPEVIRRVATDDEARLVIEALDCLIDHGTPDQRQHAYDMLHRLGARQGSDGRWRPDPLDAPPLP